MAGRDKTVGWLEVDCDTGKVYLLYRTERDQIHEALNDRKRSGWYDTDDVFGAPVRFKLEDVQATRDCTPESIAAEDADRLLFPSHDDD